MENGSLQKRKIRVFAKYINLISMTISESFQVIENVRQTGAHKVAAVRRIVADKQAERCRGKHPAPMIRLRHCEFV